MNEYIKITLIGLFFGTFGTSIGGLIGIIFKVKSQKILSFILQFAAGLMTAVVCFELIPEAINLTNISIVLGGILLGIVIMLFIENRQKGQILLANSSNNKLIRLGIIVGIGLAIHNFPEGLAIGSRVYKFK